MNSLSLSLSLFHLNQYLQFLFGSIMIQMCKQCFPSLFWWCQRLKSRIKSQASIKNQRVVKSRFKIKMKIQEKTQDIQELQEKHQGKYKKIFSKEKIELYNLSKRIFQRKIFYQIFYSLVIDYHKAVIDYQKPKQFYNCFTK